MKRYCFALDLKNDPVSIQEYDEIHRQIWPEIRESITSAGIEELEMYRTGNRLFMIMDTNDSFSLEKKSAMDAANKKVQEWEEKMWQYQQALPQAAPGEKWVLMKKIFEL